MNSESKHLFYRDHGFVVVSDKSGWVHQLSPYSYMSVEFPPEIVSIIGSGVSANELPYYEAIIFLKGEKEALRCIVSFEKLPPDDETKKRILAGRKLGFFSIPSRFVGFTDTSVLEVSKMIFE